MAIMNTWDKVTRIFKNSLLTLTAVEVKLWVDDERKAPSGWYHAMSMLDAQNVLDSFIVTECSLDHDLGQCLGCIFCVCGVQFGRSCWCSCHETGYDLVKWMAETNNWPLSRPRIHSSNPVGRDNMESVIHRYGPYGGWL